MHDVGFIDVDKKFEGMANNEDKDDANQNTSDCQISENENVQDFKG